MACTTYFQGRFSGVSEYSDTALVYVSESPNYDCRMNGSSVISSLPFSS